MSRKKDIYALPVETLKIACKRMRKGASRETVAKHILRDMQRIAAKNPALRHKLPYLQEPVPVALMILEWRLRIADPHCEEHNGWKPFLTHMRGQRRYKRHKRRLKTDPAYAAAYYDRERESQRARRATPEGRAKRQKQERARWDRLRSNPMKYEAYLASERERGRKYRECPEVREHERQRGRMNRKKLKAEREKSPELDAHIKEYNATRARARRQRMKAEEPERYQALLDRRSARARERRRLAREAFDEPHIT